MITRGIFMERNEAEWKVAYIEVGGDVMHVYIHVSDEACLHFPWLDQEATSFAYLISLQC